MRKTAIVSRVEEEMIAPFLSIINLTRREGSRLAEKWAW
jgi:hypothetical protein